MSFGMIFSIILMIIFLAFTFYAIKIFLDFKDTAQIGTFTNNLQSDVDKIWRGSQGAQEVTYILPGKVKEICFKNENKNLEISFGPKTFPQEQTIDHIEIKDYFCVENIKGKVKMVLSKKFGETLVTVTAE